MKTEQDKYDESFTIEMDRIGICVYLRTYWFKCWEVPLVSLAALLMVPIGIAEILGMLKEGRAIDAVYTALIIITALFATAVVAAVLYLCFSHRLAKKIADVQELWVDGAFLHLRYMSGRVSVDRKIHFRSITDYSVHEDKLMRKIGVKSLVMSTTGGGPGSIIQLIGVKDCEKVRDLLAEVDSLREV